MPLKLNVGICKKVGLPEYSSVGASCNLEIELDSALIRDEEGFRAAVDDAFAKCRAAVDEELARQGQVPTAAAPRPAPQPLGNRPAGGGAGPPQNGSGQGNGYQKQRGAWGGGARPPQQGYGGGGNRPPSNGNGQQRGRPPQNGKQLIAHLRGYEEEHPEAEGLFKTVVDWGKQQGFPNRMTDWPGDLVNQAVGVMQQFLSGEPSYS